MEADLTQQAPDKREFFRLKFNTPLDFKSYDTSVKESPKKTGKGSSQNISQSGVLFQTESAPPKLSSILWMNLDMRTLKICQEIESRALILNNGVLGRVVRVEEDPSSNTYDVGVVFLKNTDKENRIVKEIEQDLSKQ